MHRAHQIIQQTVSFTFRSAIVAGAFILPSSIAVYLGGGMS